MWLKLVAALGVALTCPFACADNGQTGSIGYACVEEECDQQSRALITWIADVSSPRFVASRCRAGNTGPADRESLAVQHCQCFEADGAVWLLEATGDSEDGLVSANGVVPDSDGGAGGSGAPNASAVSTEPCLARGRARGNLACAFPLDEARACTTSDPQSCEPICEQWQQGLAEAAAIHYAVELRSSRCWDTDPMLPGKRRCDAVARINGSCYATERSGFYAPTPYDCALSDEEILTLNDRADPGNVP